MAKLESRFGYIGAKNMNEQEVEDLEERNNCYYQRKQNLENKCVVD